MFVETKSGYLVETDYDDYEVEDIPSFLEKKLTNILEKYSDNKQKAIEESKKLLEENPDEFFAYVQLDIVYNHFDLEEFSKEQAQTIYEKFPDKLLARINYMDDLANEKDFDKIKEICGGEITIDNITKGKKELNLPDYEKVASILIRYYMENGEKEKAQEYYDDLKMLDGNILELRKEFFEEFIDTLKEGDPVKVKGGYVGEEYDTDMTGWQGRVAEIHFESNRVLVEWDSITLKNLDFEKIQELEDEEEIWEGSFVPAENLELCEARDTEEEVDNVYSELYDKVNEKYKVPGFPYDLYDEYKTLDPRVGRILFEILGLMQANKRSYGKINLNKFAEALEIPTVEFLKRLEELENKQLLKTFFSSVLKKDRERWIFLKTEENFDIHNKLTNKEMNIQELEKINNRFISVDA